jgi:hypothetical protein
MSWSMVPILSRRARMMGIGDDASPQVPEVTLLGSMSVMCFAVQKLDADMG